MSQHAKKILVTGGAGFLGSHLCQRLLEDGHEVLCVDNYDTGSRSNIEDLLSNRRFEVVCHNVIHPFDIEIDEIYNLACPAAPIYYQNNPVRTMKTSILGALNVLDLAKQTGARILQASTCEIYGDPKIHPQSEEYWGNVNPLGARACYDEGKRAAETLCIDYYRQYNVDIKIARIFNTYGPNMDPEDGRVVSNFIMQALKGKPITIFGDGKQTRSFCYVDDLIDGLLKMMDLPCGETGPMNLGNPVEFTILELAELVVELTKSSSEIERKPLPEDDPKQRQPDISLAREKLDWSPETSLKDGLIPVIACFENRFRKTSQSGPGSDPRSGLIS